MGEAGFKLIDLRAKSTLGRRALESKMHLKIYSLKVNSSYKLKRLELTSVGTT